MKVLRPTWFLEYPIDQEQKSYILLDYLKGYVSNIENGNIKKSLISVFAIIKDLKEFKKTGKLSKESRRNLIEEEIDLVDFYSKNPEKIDRKYLDFLLSILYKYASLGLCTLDEKLDTFKTFEIRSKGEQKQDFGFLLIRNMITDEILPYVWKAQNIEKSKIGVALKCIETSDPIYYSMSYVYIMHEILENTGMFRMGETPRLIVSEVSEDFNEKDVDLISAIKESAIDKILENQEEKE